MVSNSRVTFILIVLLVMQYSVSYAGTIFDHPKISPRARAFLRQVDTLALRKYWLYLDDSAFDATNVFLTEKAKQRRGKVDPANFLINSNDYPVSDSALTTLENTGVNVKRVSKWLKAVSIETDAVSLNRITSLSIVRKIDLVNTLTASVPDYLIPVKPDRLQLETVTFNYGASLLQNQFINAVKLHQLGLTGKGVMIAMLDTGYDINHPAFDSTNIIAAYNFIDNNTTVDLADCPGESSSRQQTFHGTFTLGIIGGYVPDTLVGIAPDADFILAKTEITCGGTEIKLEEDNWIAAAEWADSIGADIINSSLGYTEFTDGGSYTFNDLDGNTALITIAADIAASKNILVINSAGNERNKPWAHIVTPADGDSVLAVGAVFPDSSLAAFSSPGPTADGRIKPDIVTLGVNVYSAFHQGGFAFGSGTSFSAPLTAGGAALAMEYDQTYTAAELLNLIRQTASNSNNPDNNYGYGLFDAAALVDIIKFDLPSIIRIAYSDIMSIDVTTSGQTDSIAVLNAINLPNWITFIDNNDGTGVLDITITPESIPSIQFGLIADVGFFADTAYFTLEIYGLSDNFVYAGPNPFEDSVNIFIKPSAGRVRTISIFNSLGEIIWEKVNKVPLNADVMIDKWDGRNQNGKVAAAGVYILVVHTDRQTYHIKLLKTN